LHLAVAVLVHRFNHVQEVGVQVPVRVLPLVDFHGFVVGLFLGLQLLAVVVPLAFHFFVFHFNLPELV